MGLIRAITTATATTLGDQWKEYFYCDAMPADLLVTKGQKRTGKRSSNKRGAENIISDGSAIAVNEGQCMIIVEQGEIVEVCAEAGVFVYDASSEPSIFSGSLGESIRQVFATIGRRFTFGGDAGKDQRVYYFNLKEILDNRFGTREPIPFRVVDKSIGLDLDASVRLNGVYSYRIANPLLFYKNVTGNVEESFTRAEIDSQLKSEFLTFLAPALARISAMGIRYSELPAHSVALRDALCEVLTEEWTEKRGLEVVSVAINSATLPPEDEALIKDMQRRAVYRSASMGAAAIVDAQAEAMRAAAANEGGAFTGFMGMNMAGMTGGMNAGDLYARAAAEQAAKPTPASPEKGAWRCACGKENTGRFCSECGTPKPETGWKCACGATNEGKFCPECGARRPVGAPVYACDKCGFRPEDPKNPPKFCPECGDPFNDEDKQQ